MNQSEKAKRSLRRQDNYKGFSILGGTLEYKGTLKKMILMASEASKERMNYIKIITHYYHIFIYNASYKGKISVKGKEYEVENSLY